MAERNKNRQKRTRAPLPGAWVHSRNISGIQTRWGGDAGLQQPTELTAPHGHPDGSSSTMPREQGTTLITRGFPQGLGSSPLQLALR